MFETGEAKENTFSLPVDARAFGNIAVQKIVETRAVGVMVGCDSMKVLKKGF